MKFEKDYSLTRLIKNFEHLKENLRIAVIYGGNKQNPNAVINQTNNPRPWKSYETVALDIHDALKEMGFINVITISDDMNIFTHLRNHGIDFAWLNTGGVQGYNPTCHAAAMLEMAGIPYVGHNPQNSAILDNKHIFKYLLEKFGIATSPFVVWSNTNLEPSTEKDLVELKMKFSQYEGPFIVKPTSGRASLNVEYVETLDEVIQAVEKIQGVTKNHVVIEKYLPGREFCASVCGPVTVKNSVIYRNNNPFTFSVIERCLDDDERIFTSMDKKAITTSRIKLCDPEKDRKVITDLSEIAQDIYRKFSLETLVRIDFRMDKDENIHVLETNPKPDLKRPTDDITSLTCSGLEQHGMTYTDLILGILIDKIDYLLTHRSDGMTRLYNRIFTKNN